MQADTQHRTGCLIGCIRRLQGWSLTSTFDEYRRFSDPKSRAVDQQFIDLFDLGLVWDGVKIRGETKDLPEWGMLRVPKDLECGAEEDTNEGEVLEVGKLVLEDPDPPATATATAT